MEARARGPLLRVIAVVGWLIVIPLMGVALTRILRLDDRSGRLFALQTLTFWVFLPAYAVTLLAALSRLRLLSAAALLLVVIHLVLTAPDLPFRRSGIVGQGPSFSLVTANVLGSNRRAGDAARALFDLDPDVLVILELTPPIRDALEASGLLRHYPHRFENPRTDFFGSGIYSRFPVSDARRLDVGRRPFARAKLSVEGRQVALVAVHTLQPLAGTATIRAQLDQLRALAGKIDGALVLAGDFNATRQNRPFRQLLDSRLRDAHLDRGRGLARTWPTHWPLPPFALIDHVLVSDELAVRDIAEFQIPGSDHRGVISHLQLR